MARPSPAPQTSGSSPRGPGRPQKTDDGEAVRARLVRAATELFSQRGFAEVGVREVANAAGVTPAMVSYYFGDKLGLYEAMLDSVFQGLLERVTELAGRAASGEDGEDRLSAFVRMHIETLAQDPWVPQLILREVLAADGPLRERFVERFARQMTVAVQQLIRDGMEAGQLRANLDPALTMLSIMGLCVFPYLSHPISGPVLGIELDDDFRDRLVEHTVRLLRAGLGAGGATP